MAVDINKEQKYLGHKGLMVLIALLSAFVPMSTDLYLPSLPGMAKYFNSSVSLINLTVILFFVFYSAGTLLWGPLSDKYGRKPVLLSGLALYIAASLLCALAGDIYQLITYRVFQAIGGGAATAVATAMVKDAYTGKKRVSVLALVMSMVTLAPIVAPVLGALILSFTSWRGVFWILTGIGLLALIGGLALEETIDKRYSGSVLQSLGRIGVVLGNTGFTSLLVTFSLAGIPLMAFVASSSYIYISGFGLSEQVYSYYFALNATCLLLGPLLYLQLSRRFECGSIIITCFAVTAAGGLLVCALGNLHPWLFALSLLPATLAGSCTRPPSANLMLEQQQEDTGSASSLMNCFSIFMGSIGMLLISFNWSNRILALGLIHVITGLVCGALWLLLSGQSFIKKPVAWSSCSAGPGQK